MSAATPGELGAAPRGSLTRRQAHFLLFYAYFGFGSLLQVFPPLLGSIQQEFAVDHRTASLVMTLYLAPFVLVAIPAGIAADRLGVMVTGRVGLLTMLFGTMVTLAAPALPVVLAGRAIAGAGSGFLLVAVLKVGTEVIPRAQLGLALGIFAAGLPAGTGVAFNLLRPLAQLGGWRIGLLAAGGLLLSTAAVFELLASRWAQQVGLSVDPRLALRSGELWRLSTVTVLGYAAILGFTTWAPTTLVGFARIPLWAASLIASMLLIIDIPFAPLWGAVSDRIGRRRPFVIAAFTVYLIGSILVPWIAQTHAVAPLVLVIAGMGIGCAMFFPAALTIPAETVTRERVGAAYGLFFTAQVAGMLAGPVLIGQLLDASSPALGFLGVSAVTALGLVAAFTLRSR